LGCPGVSNFRRPRPDFENSGVGMDVSFFVAPAAPQRLVEIKSWNWKNLIRKKFEKHSYIARENF